MKKTREKMSELVEYENFIHTKYGFCRYALRGLESAVIFNLYVEPGCRRKGHAQKLLRYAINEIREKGYQGEIEIEASPREESIDLETLVSFYGSIGLTVTTRKRG